jgi:ABC-type phosphate transport system substrate-binding protein
MKQACIQLALFTGLCAGALTASAAEIVVIGNPGGAALTKEQIADVYLGKSQAATPLDLPEAVPTRAEFYKRATGRDLAQVKSTWSRVVFTGKGQPPKELPDVAAVKKAVAADPKAIGYIEKSAVDGTVKALATLE